MADQYSGSTTMVLPFSVYPSYGVGYYDYSANHTPLTNEGVTFEVGTGPSGSNCAYFPNSPRFFDDTYSGVGAFGTGDFTIEVYVYPITGGRVNPVWSRVLETNYYPNTGGWAIVCMYPDNPTKLCFNLSDGTILLTTNNAVANATWHFLEISRVSGSTYMFLNGVLQNSITDTHDYTANRLSIGANSTPPLYGERFYGKLANIRITKGVGRHTSGYTPSLVDVQDYLNLRPFTPRNISLGSGSRMDYKDPYFGSQSLSTAGVLSGVVKNGSVPVKRRVRLYESSTGRFVREIWAGVDGTFVFKGLDKNKKFTITSHDHLTGFNDVIAARATPV